EPDTQPHHQLRYQALQRSVQQQSALQCVAAACEQSAAPPAAEQSSATEWSFQTPSHQQQSLPDGHASLEQYLPPGQKLGDRQEKKSWASPVHYPRSEWV